LIRLQGVTKRYPGRSALQDLDLEIPRGRTTVLLGPSGSGKSTVLRLLAGLVQPDAGCILVEGRPLEEQPLAAWRHRLGYVIQEGGLFPHLRARDNAALLPRALGWSEARIADRLAELCALVRLEPELLDAWPAQLSGGQRQRVSLIRALVCDPELLLLDEPLAALDPLVRSELQEDLRRLFRELGRTVVFVTHDLPEAAFLGDRLHLLRAGRLLQSGSLDDFRQHPADPFVPRFLQAWRSLS